MAKPLSDRVLDLARKKALLRAHELDSHRIPRTYLARLANAGRLVRVGRGLYALPERNFGEHQALVEVAHRAPKAVLCLLSALRFHDLTTQSPAEVWIACPPARAQERLALGLGVLPLVRSSSTLQTKYRSRPLSTIHTA